MEVWMDCLKIKYYMRKIHEKRFGRLFNILRHDIIDGNVRGFIGDVKHLCQKYKLPDVTLRPVLPDFVSEMCKEYSRKRSMLITLQMKKIPPMLSLTKVFTTHYTYSMLDARAITCLRTGNLMFKNWTPWKFWIRHKGDLKCLFNPCQDRDSLEHVMQCEYYTTKFYEGGEGSTRDWANYLVALNRERMQRFNQPLIDCEGWSREV